jgi:hypothetical protein
MDRLAFSLGDFTSYISFPDFVNQKSLVRLCLTRRTAEITKARSWGARGLEDLYISFCSMHANSLSILNQLGSVLYSDNCR